VVFDIGGNKYRLIAEINFSRDVLFIRAIMTHKEYMKGAWKESLSATLVVDRKKYVRLANRIVVKAIESEDEYDRMVAAVEQLMDKGEDRLSPEESALLETMAILIQAHDAAADWILFVNSANVAGLIGAINNSGSAFATAVYNDLSNAQSVVAGGGFNAAGCDVIVPVNNSFPMQEFLTDGFTGGTSSIESTVPEPAAVILLGTVVGWLGLTRYRRRRRVYTTTPVP
jgi:mRNA-degrading endonuclease HigB of HigAB toxin-antitoxin module